ncbi:MAG: HAD family hydrolase [Methanobrevibacter sp.]|uniref:HAD family hydrolase n=1 Tax=Methanobrevibacter sp. TaxID=66852 RepID=UPI0025F4AABC|nr:HAD family hydrolase [Methanobrevibacter sp.]MBQ6098584.1 HAD family hydrolase [Methanobrevibacter sp.]
MKKLFIFDFDGTLFDSVADVVICFNETLEIHNFPTLTREEYLECLGGNIDGIVSLVLGENSTDENVKTVKNTYLNIHDSCKKENTVPFPKASQTLKKLQDRGILLAINSNRLNYSLNEFVEKFFSDIDFLEIEGHDEINPSKPNPYGVEKIIRKAGVDKSEAVYIGDSKTDIQTAKNAGIDCIVVKWGYGNQNDYEDDYILKAIDSYEELFDYVS